MSAALEEVIKAVHALPPQEQQQLRWLTARLGDSFLIAVVYWFVKNTEITSTADKQMLLVEFKQILDRGTSSMLPQKHILASQIRGKYREVLTSSDEFMARRAAETAKEDRSR